MSEQCPSQYEPAGCGRPAGHEGAHISVDRMSGWTSDAKAAKSGPWSVCGEVHPTAAVACYAVKGHKGKHYALTVPMPEGEPTKVEPRPFAEWSTKKGAKS